VNYLRDWLIAWCKEHPVKNRRQDVSDYLDHLMRIRKKPIRTCRTMHACCACDQLIRDGERYHDGGYGNRAHVRCLDRVMSEETEAKRELEASDE